MYRVNLMNVDFQGRQFYTNFQLIRGILTNMSIDDPIEFLKDQFLSRREKNPSYSLRAFASKLGIPAGRLSELFSRKRKLTKATAKKIAERLELDPTEATKFFHGLNAASIEGDLSLLDTSTRGMPGKQTHSTTQTGNPPSGEINRPTIIKSFKDLNINQSNDRENLSITITIDPRKVHQAKDMIHKFQKEFVNVFDDDNYEEEYILKIQFLPMSK